MLSYASKVVQIYPLLEDVSWTIHLSIFYGVCALILLTLALIFYAERTNEIDVSVRPWPVRVLCLWLTLLLTILYLPTVGVMLSVVDCEYVDGTLVHASHHEVKCFQGTHWVHALLAMFAFLIEVAMAELFAVLFYDTHIQGDDLTARTNSYYEAWELAYKSGLVLLTIFIKWNGGEWLLCLYMCIVAGILYVKYANRRRFVFTAAQKVCKCFALIHLWIAAVYCYVFVLQDFESGGVEIMLLGAVLLVVTIWMERDSDWETFLRNKKVMKSPDTAIHRIYAYLMLTLNRGNTAECMVILKGYNAIHASLCLKPNCPLKVRADIAGGKRKSKSDKEVTQILFMHANELFLDAIAQFPRSNALRLTYSLFLIEVLNNQSTALEELAAVSLASPSVEEQCLVHRYKQMIKDGLLASKKEDSEKMNITAVMAYESHYSLFKEKVERTALFHVQFWSMLLDDAPDLSKLKDLGYQIEQYVDEIELHWERMQELDPDVPEVLKFYAVFTEEVLNDRDTCALLTKRLKFAGGNKLSINKRKAQAANTSNIEMLSAEGDPCVCVSGQQNKLGIITQCNLAFCRVFGYNKKEMIGLGIAALMPEMYAAFHQEVLLNDLQRSSRETNGESFRRDRRVLGKTKAGYVVPLWLSVLSRPTLLNDSNYVGIMHVDKASADSGILYFLLNRQSLVVGISSSAIIVCGLYPYMLRYAKLPFATLCPELNLAAASPKAEVRTLLYLPDLGSFEGWNTLHAEDKTHGETTPGFVVEDFGACASEKSEEIPVIKRSELHHPVICQVEPVEISTSGRIGYVVRAELVGVTRLSRTMEPESGCPSFQFRFEAEVGRYIREAAVAPGAGTKSGCDSLSRMLTRRSAGMRTLRNTSSKDSAGNPNVHGTDVSNMMNLTPKEIIMEMAESPPQGRSAFLGAVAQSLRQIGGFVAKEPDTPANAILNENLAALLRHMQVDYSEDVTTYRIHNGEMVEVTDQPLQVLLLAHESHNDNVDDEVMGVESKSSGTDKKSAFLIASNIKGRRSLKNALTNGDHAEINWTAASSYLLLAALFALAVVNYVYLADFFNTFNLQVDVINLSYKRLINEQAIMYNVLQLVLVHE